MDGRTAGDDTLARYVAWLNPAELERYRRFVRPERQRQFLIGRILLRLALAKLMQVQPTTISLTERPGNAPLLHWAQPAPGFSLSHSGPWVACAVSAQTVLGLDIEVMNPARDLSALSTQVFDADDIACLRAQPDKKQVAAFYALWSIQEARYKLASTHDLASGQSCIALPHRDISMVLCSALPLVSVAIHPFLICNGSIQ
ncbi:MAG: 4'-phosphopantetheinyl transferase family protein [Burkholderiaceae bacterium]